MVGTTRQRLVAAASDLLDAGGQAAVTLRGVAEVVGVSHNAPYRHFRDRSALLAAVAERDLDELRHGFEAESGEEQDAGSSLRAAAMLVIAYARAHQARYRLLFSDPDLASADGGLEDAALRSFKAFTAIVRRCQSAGILPPIEAARLTGLIHATLHGAIDLELGGRAKEAKGLGDIEATVDLLLDLLMREGRPVEVR